MVDPVDGDDSLQVIDLQFVGGDPVDASTASLQPCANAAMAAPKLKTSAVRRNGSKDAHLNGHVCKNISI